MKLKNPKTLKNCSLVSAILAVVMLIGRIAMGMEMSTVEKSGALFVVSGSKEMTRSDYMEYASKLNTTMVILLVVFAVLAVVAYSKYKKSTKQ